MNSYFYLLTVLFNLTYEKHFKINEKSYFTLELSLLYTLDVWIVIHSIFVGLSV